MSWIPAGTEQWPRSAPTQAPKVSPGHRMLSITLRAIFIASVLIAVIHLSLPQSATIWRAYEAPGDFVRLALGLAVAAWVAFQLFTLPKDPHAHRTWLYLGLAAVPFVLICIIGLW